MVRTQCFRYRGTGLIPGWGAKILQAAWHSKSKAKQTLEVNGWDLTLTMDFLDSRYI